MANYASLKAAIQQVVKTNGNNEITGALLQQSLLAMIDSLGVGFQFMGIATPSTNPGTPDQNVFYISGPGTFANFNNFVVPDGNIGIFQYSGSWSNSTLQVGENYDSEINTALNTIVWEQGSFDSSGNEVSSSYQLRSSHVLFENVYAASSNVADSFAMLIFYYDENGQYISRDTDISVHPSGYAKTVRFVLAKDGVRITTPEVAGFDITFTKRKVLEIVSTILTLATKQELTTVTDKAEAIERLLNMEWSYNSPSIQRANSRINDEGTVVSSSGYDITTPIALQKGETIIFDGLVSLVVAAISITDSSGASYTVKVMGATPATDVLEYRYTATENCYVALCYNKQNAPTRYLIAKSIYIEDIETRTETAIANVDKMAGALSQPIRIIRGGWYNTFVTAPGQSASMAYTQTSDYGSVIVNALAGEIYFLTGRGGTSPKLWALLETNSNKVISVAANGAQETNYKIEIPQDCRLVVNVQTAYQYELMKVNDGVGSVINIEQFSKLNKLNDEPLFKINYFLGFAGIIHHWGFVGDSLMGGYMENSGVSEYEYSWGQRMCNILGVKGYNFSIGGQTTKGWIDDAGSDVEERRNRSWGGAKTNLKQAYIIGLGVNDRNQSYGIGDVSTDIGTYDAATDTDTNAATFAGYYAGIIQRLRSVNPTAKIFVVTIPQNSSWANVNDYNAVIRGMATAFSNVYVIDLYTYADNFYSQNWLNNYFESGHYNVVGYEYSAAVMLTYIDWIIRNNYSSFENVNQIPFTE